MSTWPQLVIPVFAAGYAPQAPAMNGWVQASLGFCSAMPVFRAQKQAAQALTAGTFAPLQAGATAGDILEDPYAGWSATATAAQPAWSYLVPFTGWYEVTLTILTAAFSGWLTALVQVSGGTAEIMGNAQVPASGPGGVPASLIIPATGGIDYIQAGPQASAAVNTDITAGQLCALEIAYVSSG